MRKLVVLICVLMMGFCMFAQSSVNASGGNASGNAGKVSYSIGQPFYSSTAGALGKINEGVQLPYDIYDVTEVPSTMAISMSVFPNPTHEYLTLSVEDDDFEAMEMYIYDISGKEIMQQRISSSETAINMKSLPSATYFVRITKGKNEVKTFKVVKR